MKGKKTNLVLGAVLVLIGIVFLLNNLGIIKHSVWDLFKTYWPFLIVIMGIAMLFRIKWLSAILIVAVIGIAVLFFMGKIALGEPRTVEFEVPSAGVEEATLDVDFGAGEINIMAGEPGLLVDASLVTASAKDPKTQTVVKGSSATVLMDRQKSGRPDKEKWDIMLSPDVVYDLDLDYGAADVAIDLRGLKVKDINVDTGASKTEITFDSYPTDLELDTGAATVLFKFPEDVGVKITADTGMVDIDFDGFTKEEGIYYSDNYDDFIDRINIDVSAGASTLKAEWY